MKDQPAGGHVFNMDGAGADGNATPRFAAYGATKRSLQQVRSLLKSPPQSRVLTKVAVKSSSGDKAVIDVCCAVSMQGMTAGIVSHWKRL